MIASDMLKNEKSTAILNSFTADPIISPPEKNLRKKALLNCRLTVSFHCASAPTFFVYQYVSVEPVGSLEGVH